MKGKEQVNIADKRQQGGWVVATKCSRARYTQKTKNVLTDKAEPLASPYKNLAPVIREHAAF